MLREIARKLSDTTYGPGQRSAIFEAEPPYHKVANGVIWVGFNIDIARVRPFVPSELRLSEDSIGILGLYQAPTGWGLAPYTRGLLGVTVTGHDASDTGEGIFNLGGVMNEPAADIVRRRYSAAVSTGEARTWTEGDLVHGVASVGGHDWLRATVRPSTQVMAGLSGVDSFLGLTADGLLRHADTYEADATAAELVSMEITADAPAAMRAMQPRGLVFCVYFPRVSSAWSEPRPIATPGGDGVSFYLDLIEGTGRAAVILKADGTVLGANASAASLLGKDLLRPGESLLPGALVLRNGLERSVPPSGARMSEPVVVTRQGRESILAHVLPFDRFGRGEGLQLVLLAEAGGPARQDAARMLQLLGLTQAEARLAAQVGHGLGVRDAAKSLSISEHTARSTLRSVYDKLGIGKQSELGHLVARLQYL